MDKRKKIELILNILLIAMALVLLVVGAFSKDTPRIVVACGALLVLGFNIKKILSSKN